MVFLKIASNFLELFQIYDESNLLKIIGQNNKNAAILKTIRISRLPRQMYSSSFEVIQFMVNLIPGESIKMHGV